MRDSQKSLTKYLVSPGDSELPLKKAAGACLVKFNLSLVTATWLLSDVLP